MKKFGTPMRAGPGSASEKVGFSGVGEPSGFSAGGAASLGLRTLSLARPTPESRFPSARLTGFSSVDGRCLVEPLPASGVAAAESPPPPEFPPPVLPPPPCGVVPGSVLGRRGRVGSRAS